jgi:plasmid stabilization system protein ParE
MAFTVILRRKAQADIAGRVAWLEAAGRPSVASRWRVGLLASVVANLEADPRRYPQADEATDLGLDLRVLLHGRRPIVHRVLFTIDGQTVNVHRIRHAAQDQLEPGDV